MKHSQNMDAAWSAISGKWCTASDANQDTNAMKRSQMSDI